MCNAHNELGSPVYVGIFGEQTNCVELDESLYCDSTKRRKNSLGIAMDISYNGFNSEGCVMRLPCALRNEWKRSFIPDHLPYGWDCDPIPPSENRYCNFNQNDGKLTFNSTMEVSLYDRYLGSSMYNSECIKIPRCNANWKMGNSRYRTHAIFYSSRLAGNSMSFSFPYLFSFTNNFPYNSFFLTENCEWNFVESSQFEYLRYDVIEEFYLNLESIIY